MRYCLIELCAAKVHLHALMMSKFDDLPECVCNKFSVDITTFCLAIIFKRIKTQHKQQNVSAKIKELTGVISTDYCSLLKRFG